MAFLKRNGIMLAYPADVKRISAFPLLEQEDGSKQRVFFHQPKLNGERARTEWFSEAPYLISSYGNEFKFLDHIQCELKVLAKELGNDYKFDGEIYKHGWSRERIDSSLRRTKNRNPDTPELEYHIFDWQTGAGMERQYDRIRVLGTMEQAIERLGLRSLKIVPYGICSEVDWLNHCGSYCEEGYEGIILRNPFAYYEEKRVPGLLKFKPTETDEYRIVAVNEAVCIETGQPKGMVGSFTVAAIDEPGNVTFDVGAGKLKHVQRQEYWQRRVDIVGKMLLVKHELLRTTNQVPIAAVTVSVIE